MISEIANYVDQRKIRGVTDSKVMNKAISDTLDKGQRFFPSFKAFSVLTHGLNEFFQHSALEWQLTTSLHLTCSKEEGLRLKVKSSVDADKPDVALQFIDIQATEHSELEKFHALTGKELMDLHLDMGRTYKDYSYPPAVIFWSMSSWFQGAGWFCDTFEFDKEQNTVTALFIEPTERKQTVRVRVDFKVLITDCTMYVKPEPEPEAAPAPSPEFQGDDIYVIPNGVDQFGRPLQDNAIYRLVKDGENLRWSSIPKQSEKLVLGTTYIRLNGFMVSDVLLAATFDIYEVYKDVGFDFIGLARFCSQQGDPNQIFRDAYVRPE